MSLPPVWTNPLYPFNDWAPFQQQQQQQQANYQANPWPYTPISNYGYLPPIQFITYKSHHLQKQIFLPLSNIFSTDQRKILRQSTEKRLVDLLDRWIVSCSNCSFWCCAIESKINVRFRWNNQSRRWETNIENNEYHVRNSITLNCLIIVTLSTTFLCCSFSEIDAKKTLVEVYCSIVSTFSSDLFWSSSGRKSNLDENNFFFFECWHFFRERVNVLVHRENIGNAKEMLLRMWRRRRICCDNIWMSWMNFWTLNIHFS